MFREDGSTRWGRLFLYVVLTILFLTGLSLVSRYIGLGAGYLAKPAEILDVNNVEAEYEWFYTHQQALRSVRADVNAVHTMMSGLEDLHGVDKSKWTLATREEYNQHLAMRTQLVTAYNQKCGEYQARWDNIFHNVVAPTDIPRDCELIGAAE